MGPAQHDIAIIGGGPVGAALALALAQNGHSLLLIEATPAPATPNDPRTLALSAGSRLILERIGVWPVLAKPTPIRRIHVSQRGAFGRAVMTAAEAGVPALGYVVSYASLQRAFSESLESSRAVTAMAGARVTRVHSSGDHVEIDIAQGGVNVQAKLAVIADGSAAAVEPAEIEVRDYRQSAVIANARASKTPDGTAFERFTPDGPLALLPHGDGYALIWTLAADRALAMSRATDAIFLESLQQAFGDRVGTFVSAGPRTLLPLRLRVSRRPTRARQLLIGNAAQALHPVAGQGLNLGLRDAWQLSEVIGETSADPGAPEIVDAYTHARRNDRRNGVILTDALVRIFSNDITPLSWLRGCGLTLLDSVPQAKRAFMRQTMFGSAI
ncbi:MAG: hypothetical protein C5B46_00445 [Proteobacteria bacterium]|nr:MAG: hypothetical protein C5B46_00445 [Pseudomonadota bacterium]